MDRKNIKKWLTGLIALSGLMQVTAFAVVIGPNTIINSPVTYSNDSVDLNNGNIIIADGGSLTIDNCRVFGKISATNPNLISVQRGDLKVNNSIVTIETVAVDPTPKTESSYYAIRVNRSSAINLESNLFTVDKQFRVGLLTTSLLQPAKNLVIKDNKFQNFHGVLYLLNSYNSKVEGNLFQLNSGGHVVLVGNKSNIAENTFVFSGLNQLGNAMDLVDSENVTISKNNIFTPTSVGIAVTLSKNVLIDRNTITGGITYGIHLFSNIAYKHLSNEMKVILNKLEKRAFKHRTTSYITISNNRLGQNRYGIAATDVDGLNVVDNFFTQRFENSAARKFWTDNSVLLNNVTGLTWLNNYYKEAFTQVNGGDNSLTNNIVEFPATGGVVL